METKEIESKIEKVMSIYYDVIDDYDKLHDIFNFNNPIQIYEMYRYLYTNNYLTFFFFWYQVWSEKSPNGYVERSFELNNKSTGFFVIYGFGCCRHVSTMMRDIFKKRKINSEVLTVTDFYPHIALKERIFWNHQITIAEYNDITYYFDPMKELILVPKDNRLYSGNAMMEVKLNSIIYYLESFPFENKFNNIKNIIQKSNAELLEIQYRQADIATKTLIENIDILEKFYKMEKDKYEELRIEVYEMKSYDLKSYISYKKKSLEKEFTKGID